MKSAQLTSECFYQEPKCKPALFSEVTLSRASAMAPVEKNSTSEWDKDKVSVQHFSYVFHPSEFTHTLVVCTSDLWLWIHLYHKAQWRERLSDICTHTANSVCTDSMHTAAYTHIQTQTYWSIVTHMHACAPEHGSCALKRPKNMLWRWAGR